MNRTQKLDAIYEVMADKTLSQWCKVFYWEDLIVGDVVLTFDDELAYRPVIESIIDPEVYEIIWHPVRIGDVLDYISNNYDMTTKPSYAMIVLWHLHRNFSFHRLPIDEQSEECIDFVYSLIQK